ncbi:hypothetical protein GCM10010315_44900 [Streptomyces luteosporeus]|uniref:Uncharacterized protein n=1 Tax=Streptomyces luteosporeus TaxID=173856 RepID=A0ABP6GGQ3_9ACTN
MAVCGAAAWAGAAWAGVAAAPARASATAATAAAAARRVLIVAVMRGMLTIRNGGVGTPA